MKKKLIWIGLGVLVVAAAGVGITQRGGGVGSISRIFRYACSAARMAGFKPQRRA